LNGPRASDLTGAHVNGQGFSCLADLFGEVEGWNAMAGRDIENSQTRAKVEMLQ
jgi:hypothetical protein